MRIEELWQELDADAQAGVSGAWLTRFALPQPAQPLLVALEVGPNRRALLLPLPKAVVPPRRDWPQCRGLEVFSAAIAGQPHLGARLLEAACADVFTALAEDLALRVAAATNAKAAAMAFIGRLLRWQKFLSAGTLGLSPDEQRGLYGELRTIRDHLVPALGAAATIKAWRGPTAAHQDFQLAAGAVEVKTTVAKQPQAIRITSERQLDGNYIPALFLHVVILDEREPQGSGPNSGESLPDIVNALRTQFQPEANAAEAFEDGLLDAGYLDAHAPRYEGRQFALRRERTFRVSSKFPRLVEGDLPTGVGDVSYALSLAACEPFAITSVEMLSALQAPV